VICPEVWFEEVSPEKLTINDAVPG
jgi:hypothetical protein